MRPILFHLGPFPIYAYGFMILLAFACGIKLTEVRFRAKGMDPEVVYDLGLVAMISGILGARIFYLIQYNYYFDWSIFSWKAGFLASGSIIGGMIFIACFRQIKACTYLSIVFLAIVAGRYKGILQTSPGTPHLVDFILLLMIGYFCGKNVKPIWNYLKSCSLFKRFLFGGGFFLSLLVGMKFLHCYLYASYYSKSLEIFMIWKGGLVFYGGFILAVVAMVAFLKKKNLPIWKVCDILAPSVALGIAFTRIGCFLNGCCYGGVCSKDFPFGVHFPPHSLVGQVQNLRGINLQHLWHHYFPSGHAMHISWLKVYLPADLYSRIFEPVYPTQLISSLAGIVLFLFLLWFYRHRKHDGEVVLMFGIVYSVFRFLIEILRNDTQPVLGTGLTVSQNISYILFCISAGIFIFLRLRDRWLKTEER